MLLFNTFTSFRGTTEACLFFFGRSAERTKQILLFHFFQIKPGRTVEHRLEELLGSGHIPFDPTQWVNPSHDESAQIRAL